MFANETEVRRLAKNVKQALSLDEIQSAAAVVDVKITAMLSPIVEFPIDPNGVNLALPANLPDTIQQIANLMTAGLVELRGYAYIDGGESRANSYGQLLYDNGMEMLTALADLSVPFIDVDLTMDAPIRGVKAPQTFFPVQGFKRGNRGYNRY